MKNLFLFFAILSIVSSRNTELYAQNRQADSLALVTLYQATDGANWQVSGVPWSSSWDLNTPMDTWYGVFLNGGRVERLTLSGNNLVGTLPDLNLTAAEYISLDRNQLSGNTPNFSSLINVKILALSDNQLSGSIPDFANLPTLEWLLLGQNNLTGTIPDFSNLLLLQQLDLEQNNFLGFIPDFSNFPVLWRLNLSGNQLTGSIPDFSSVPQLIELNLSRNQLSGTIPDFSNVLSLERLYLFDNQLSGTIPNFSNLGNLVHLYLATNQLSGQITNFSALPLLTDLGLSGNNLSGTIPAFTNLPQLIFFDAQTNQLTGAIPDLSGMPKLVYFYVYRNKLNGSTAALAQASSLRYVHLHNNQFTFEDLLPSHDSLMQFVTCFACFKYSPQDSIGTVQTIYLVSGQTYTIDLAIDDTVTTNTYIWYKDGMPIDTTYGVNEYTINLFSLDDVGIYTVKISNSRVTQQSYYKDLVLDTRPLLLDIGVGVQDLPTIPTLQVQPNPVRDILYINTQTITGDFEVQVTNIQGQVVQQLKGTGNTLFALPMNTYPSGVYIVRLQQDDQIWQQKVVKQ